MLTQTITKLFKSTHRIIESIVYFNCIILKIELEKGKLELE